VNTSPYEQTSLSAKAMRYLQTKPRYPALSNKLLQQALNKQKIPVLPQWLDFHERYAGYDFSIGNDKIILGLIHQEHRSWPGDAYAVTVIGEASSDQYTLACADAHPSFQFELDQTGRFQHGPHSNFDMYVERCAAFDEFAAKGQITRHSDTSEASIVHRVQQEAVQNTALSDDISEYWESDTLVAIRSVADGVWTRIDTVDVRRTGQTLYKSSYVPPSGKRGSGLRNLLKGFKSS